MAKIIYSEWLRKYCKTEQVNETVVDGCCRALFLSSSITEHDSLESWLDRVNLGPIGSEQVKALQDLWDAMHEGKKKAKRKKVTTAKAPVVDAGSHNVGHTPQSIDEDKPQM